ncbi:hypothetical protein BGX26_001883 [Mortierella sp. AD094]|nr:hypothetical protein BGX26_001883 [Mortierella sp. AD094]
MEANSYLEKTKVDSLIELPTEIISQIALELPCREFSRFIQTSKFLYESLNQQWAWHQRFVRRFGSQCLLKDIQEPSQDSSSTCNISMDKLKEMYNHYCIVHLDGNHWRLGERAGSTFNPVAELHGVWWLDASAVFYGVPQGRYRIQWNCEMKRSFPALETEFRAIVTDPNEIPLWDSTLPSAVSFTLSNEIQLMERATHPDVMSYESLFSGFFILQIPDVLVINESYQNVLVQLRNHKG